MLHSESVLPTKEIGAPLVTEIAAAPEVSEPLFDVAAALLVGGAFGQRLVVGHAATSLEPSARK